MILPRPIFVQLRFTVTPAAEALTPDFDAPSNYKDPQKIASYIADKKANWAVDEAVRLPLLAKPQLIRTIILDASNQVAVQDHGDAASFFDFVKRVIQAAHPGIGDVFPSAPVQVHLVGYNLHLDLSRLLGWYFLQHKCLPWGGLAMFSMLLNPVAALRWNKTLDTLGCDRFAKFLDLPTPADASPYEQTLVHEYHILWFTYSLLRQYWEATGGIGYPPGNDVE